MKARFLLAVLAFVPFAASGCRGAQLRAMEERQDQLEARVARLEGQVETLARK